MRVLIPKRTAYTVEYQDVEYEQVLLGGVVDTDAPIDPAVEWTAGSYAVGDVIKIDALQTKFTCLEATSEYPAISINNTAGAWYPQPLNESAILDTSPTTYTETIASATVTSMFFKIDVSFTDYLIGEEIRNCDEVVIESLDSGGLVIEELYRINMQTLRYFSCCDCCNPPAVEQRLFVVSLEGAGCGDYTEVKVTFTKRITDQKLKVGSLYPARGRSIGCAQFGLSFGEKTESQYSVNKKLQQIREIKQGTYRELNGTTIIDDSLIVEAVNTLRDNQGYYNFYQINEDDNLGIVANLSGTHEYKITAESKGHYKCQIDVKGAIS